VQKSTNAQRARRLASAAVPLAAVVSLALAGCGSSSPSAGKAVDTVGKTVAGATNPSFRAPNLAGQTLNLTFDTPVETSKMMVLHAVSLLQDWGASVTVNYVDSEQIGFASLIRGGTDAVAEDEQSGVEAVEANTGIIAYALASPRLDINFVCKPGITSLSKLKRGVTIGVVDTTGINLVEAAVVMKAAGLSLNDAKLIVTGAQSDRAAALLSGRTDCTVLNTSNSIEVAPQGYRTIYSFIKDDALLSNELLWTTPAWLAKNPKLALAVNEALTLSYRWIDDTANKQAFIKDTMAAVPGTTASQVSQLYTVYVDDGLTPPNASLTESLMSYQVHLFASLGALSKVIPVSKFADLTFAAQALANVGKAS
jgi:ABC-type nitrate/sulfonate/bicarbonate transport system substrate-binding protein